MARIVKIVSWNVRRLNDKFKRASVFYYLKPLKPHVVLLQETHLDERRVLALRRPWVQRVLHAIFSSLILISKAVPCTIQYITIQHYTSLIWDVDIWQWYLKSFIAK